MRTSETEEPPGPDPLVRDDTVLDESPRGASRPGARRTVLVVLPLLVGLAVTGGVGGRLLLGETEPASATGSVTCWDGEEVDAPEQCGRPRGTDGLTRVFPSFRPDQVDCVDELERNPTYTRPAMWTCKQSIGGRPVAVTYSEVTARKPAVRFLDDLHGEDARGVVRTLRGGATAQVWTPQATDDGAWEGSLLLREGPYAVTVRAQRRRPRAGAPGARPGARGVARRRGGLSTAELALSPPGSRWRPRWGRRGGTRWG